MKDVDIQEIRWDDWNKAHIWERHQSYAEEAVWWDTTDTGAPEYEQEFHPVNARFSERLTRSMQIRFDPATDHALEERAKELGVKKSTLVRMWVKERLRQDQERRAS